MLVGYLLTAAVSLTAGVEAIASAFPSLWPYRVHLAILSLFLIMILNLRGVQETGTLMSIPVYLFLVSYFIMLVYGGIRIFIDPPILLEFTAPPATEPFSYVLVLQAFAAGCTALTGIEAISNGVPVFKTPEVKNAKQTLLAMAFLMGLLFFGSVGLIRYFGVVAGPQETILSALARHLLGSGFGYFLVQITTMLVLVVAANTSFSGFPRLLAILAKDSYVPRQLSALGDRLVFQNGIIVLALGTAFLIIIFGGDTHALVPLFAIGVFLAFTLSQTGMVVYWQRKRLRAWKAKLLLNGIGALVTGAVTLLIAVTRFAEGAWITIALIPLIMFVFTKIKGHYQMVAEQLSLGTVQLKPQEGIKPRAVIPVSGVHRGIYDAVDFSRAIAKDITAVYIEIEPDTGEAVVAKWKKIWPNIPIVVLKSQYRSVIKPLLEYLDEVDNSRGDGQLATVVLPEFIAAHWWESFLHNQTAWLIKAALLYRRRNMGYQRVIIDVPYHLVK